MDEMGKPYTSKEDKIIKQYFGTIPGPKVAYLLPGRTVESIRKRAINKLGLSGGGRSKLCAMAKTQYTFVKQFFDRPNIECSYWAGFIAADGCVYKRTLNINLGIKDKQHLVNFAHALSFTGPIIDRPGPNNRWQTTLRIHGATNLIDALHQNYNITERKSLTLQPPKQLNTENTHAFIVGYIDGDGSIQVTSQNYPRVFIRGTKAMLLWIKQEFDDIIQDMGNYPMASVLKSSSDRSFSYTLTGRRFIVVARKLLILDLPLMTRKWNLIQTLLG